MRTPLTIEDHCRASELITDVDTRVSQLLKLLQGRPDLRCKTLDRLLHIDGHVHGLRLELESAMVKRHAHDRRATTSIYFPAPQPEATR